MELEGLFNPKQQTGPPDSFSFPTRLTAKLLLEQIVRCSWLWSVSGRTFRVTSLALLTWINPSFDVGQQICGLFDATQAVCVLLS